MMIHFSHNTHVQNMHWILSSHWFSEIYLYLVSCPRYFQFSISSVLSPKQPASVLQDFDIEDSKLTNPCYVRIRDATGENQRGMMATTPENTISISDATTKSGKDQIYSFLDQQRVFDGLRSTTWIQQIDYYHEANKTRMVASRPSHHPGWQFDYYRYADNPQSEAIEKESFYYLVPGPVETPRSAVLKSIQYLFHNRQLLDALLEQASIKREASARYRRKYPPRPPLPAWMLAVRGSSRLLHLLPGGYWIWHPVNYSIRRVWKIWNSLCIKY